MGDVQNVSKEPEWPGFVFAVCAVTVVIAWSLFISWFMGVLSDRL